MGEEGSRGRRRDKAQGCHESLRRESEQTTAVLRGWGPEQRHLRWHRGKKCSLGTKIAVGEVLREQDGSKVC